MTSHQLEVAKGQRFEFGKNWSRYLRVLNDERIREAERSLQMMLGCERLDGKRFLDAGSGSGLFSLAAYRLGATVHSFDFDPQSVATTHEMRRRFCSDEKRWQVEEGSVLDEQYLKGLGHFDVVYSWGVLHHTGNMWKAMRHVASLVGPHGALFIALYNDQGALSRFWLKVKKLYCSGLLGRFVVVPMFFGVFAVFGLLEDLFLFRNPMLRYTQYRKARGMSLVHDWIDWLGGLPFETAKPDEVLDLYREQGYQLVKLTTRRTFGCNEFVFKKST